MSITQAKFETLVKAVRDLDEYVLGVVVDSAGMGATLIERLEDQGVHVLVAHEGRLKPGRRYVLFAAPTGAGTPHDAD